MPSHDPRHIDGRELPQYRSHKIVGALQIAGVDGLKLSFVDNRYKDVICEDGMFARYQPKAGDFFVVYEDGYKSFSPRTAFLEGYTLVRPGEHDGSPVTA